MPRPHHTKARQSVVAICRRMNALGINQGTSGNVSVRAGDGFLISPSGIPYDSLAPEQVVEMDLDGGYFGDWRPSSEWRLHTDIYASRPEAGAIVHTHSPHATALACLRQDVPAFHYMVAAAGGPTLRCAEYATFGTKELSVHMLKALEGRSACLLANHGAVAFGADLDAALALAVEVESLCRQYILARQLGTPVVLDPAEMTRILKLFESYGKQEGDGDLDAEARARLPVRRDEPSG